MMGKKRSKILLGFAILVIVIFLFIQVAFQRTNLIPQLPTFPLSITERLKASEKRPSAVEDGYNEMDSVKEETVQSPIPNSIISSSQSFKMHVDEDQSKIVIDHVNFSQILKNDLNEHHEQKPDENNSVTPEPEPTVGVINQEDDGIRGVKVMDPQFYNGDQIKSNFRIILWTDFFQVKDYIKDEAWKSDCAHTNCQFTSERNSYHSADALIFHAADIDVNDLPISPRNPLQRWIYLNHESPPHTIFSKVAALNGLVNWTVTYRLDSDILLSPLFIPAPTFLPEMPINHFRPGKVAWLVSNCKTPSNRESFVDELKKHISIDVYGACGNLTCLPKMANQCYETLAEKYYFYLSFENSLCPDYVTEKLFSVLNYPIVPIVFGGADYPRIAPPNSYIDALSFESPAKLADYLNHLTQSPDEYDVYFNWKRFYLQTYKHYGCQICTALNRADQSTVKTWDTLSQWWFEEASCNRWINGKLIPWKQS